MRRQALAGLQATAFIEEADYGYRVVDEFRPTLTAARRERRSYAGFAALCQALVALEADHQGTERSDTKNKIMYEIRFAANSLTTDASTANFSLPENTRAIIASLK